ncbi:MAG: hypothetical protein ACYTGV_03015, partial [Planctomycetota bacterium]
IGSDAAAGPTNSKDLEVYAFDANVGGDLVALTSGVTDGVKNAINHLYVSADGNFLVGQRAPYDGDSGRSSSGGRGSLNGESDLFAVTNVHAVLEEGAIPMAFVVSGGMSHGSTVAFVGENTPTGPQAVIYSSAASGGNGTWDDRTLKINLLTPGGVAQVLDETESHYVVLAGTRKIDDDPEGGN